MTLPNIYEQPLYERWREQEAILLGTSDRKHLKKSMCFQILPPLNLDLSSCRVIPCFDDGRSWNPSRSTSHASRASHANIICTGIPFGKGEAEATSALDLISKA